MNKFLLISFCLWGCFFITQAQSDYKRLHAGDSVPDLELRMLRNYPSPTAKLSDFRGKCVILDFWSIYCSSCIAGFPALQALQQQFPNDLQVILVTANNNTQVEAFGKKFSFLQKTSLPVATGDTLLSNHLFPHATVPYQVWLNGQGIVQATTSAASATVTAVRNLIQGKRLNISNREDRTDSAVYRELRYGSAPIFTVDKGSFIPRIVYFSAIPNVAKKNNANNYDEWLRPPYDNRDLSKLLEASYYSVLLDALPGIKPVPFSGIVLTDKKGQATGIRYLNKPVYYLLQAAYDPGNEYKLLVDKETGIEGPPGFNQSTAIFSNWYNQNRYCHEIKMDGFTEEKARSILQQDIEQFFGITARRQKRIVNCLILCPLLRTNRVSINTITDTALLNETTTGALYKEEMNIAGLLQSLKNYYRGMNDPVIMNETGLPQQELLSFYIDAHSLHIPSLKQQLARYGLDIRYENRETDVWVISPRSLLK